MADTITWVPNVPVEGTLIQPLEYSHHEQYGDGWWLKIKDSGTSLERSKCIKAVLAERIAGAKVGDLVRVKKEDHGTGPKDVRWRVAVNGAEVTDEAKRSFPALPREHNTSSASNAVQGTTGGSTSTPTATLAELSQLYGQCLTMAHAALQDVDLPYDWTQEDVRQIGTALYIEANRKGILAIKDTDEEAIAAEATQDGWNEAPPPTEADEDQLPF